MKNAKPIKIVSMGKYLPGKISSGDLEKKLSIPSGWCERYSGVEFRHHATTETNGYMGAKAADLALDKANLKLSDMDLIISAAGTYDYPLPNQASVIKSLMKDGGISDVAAIDVDSTCLSFVTAFDIAARMLDGTTIKNILIISSEIASKGLNEDNWETATLFGDGAAAAILQYDESGPSSFIKGGQKTYSKGMEYSMIKGGGNAFFFKDHPYDKELHSFHMQGKQLLRLAKEKIPEFMDWFYEDLPFNFLDADVIIPHQASKAGLMIVNDLFNFKEGQIKSTLRKYGNCIAASIPLTLNDLIEAGEIKRGDQCMLCGTSAGFSIGGVLITY
jgi:3-oxoacyl-[acyl-carrier-protein] synthase III